MKDGPKWATDFYFLCAERIGLLCAGVSALFLELEGTGQGKGKSYWTMNALKSGKLAERTQKEVHGLVTLWKDC